MENTTAEEMNRLKDEIERIRVELSRLANFSTINYNAIQKILTKHDKNTEYMLKPMFTLRLSNKHAALENLDSLVYRLSKLYDKLRRRAEPGREETSTESQQFFVRKTTKYWVHPDNVADVKCAILKYLPVLVFPSDARVLDPAVSSVYYDNAQMDLYQGRLEKTEGAEAIRIRWYGKSEQPAEVFVERKLHREDWTGEISVKARFPIKEKHLNEYIEGTYTVEQLRAKLAKTGKYSEEELEKLTELAAEIQNSIKEKKLRPTIRTFYSRIAFQLPGDARVRISLDTDLCMIREDGSERSGKNWRRLDVRGELPYTGLPKSDVERFPYAVLEVKLQTEAGQEPPTWVQKLADGHLVEAVPKFSKYIHGCATLLHNRVKILPYWYHQMDVDIRKPPSEKAQIIEKADNVMNEEDYDAEDDEGNSHESLTDLTGKTPELQPHVAIPIKEQADEKAPLLSKASGRSRKPSMGPDLGSSSREQEKRIVVPVRIEPKVFFANERTFLSWVHFSIFLGGISTALVGLGNRTARLSGYMFAGVSILFTIYALYLYLWRAKKIRERDPGPYDDLVGPWVVVVVFLGAMVVNIIVTSAQVESI